MSKGVHKCPQHKDKVVYRTFEKAMNGANEAYKKYGTEMTAYKCPDAGSHYHLTTYEHLMERE